MSEHIAVNRVWQLRPRWGVVAEYTEAKLTGLMVLDDISHERLSSISLRQIATYATAGTHLEWDHPPTRDQIEQAMADESARVLLDGSDQVDWGRAIDTLRKFGVRFTGSPGWSPTPSDLERIEGEPVSEFYKRVAVAYRAFAEQTGKPLLGISELAGVKKGTAARWVREARKRGYLPPGEKGKVG